MIVWGHGADIDGKWSKKWLDMPLSERTAVLEDYHSNGIALMVTAFGSTGESMLRLALELIGCRLPHGA